MILLVLGRRWNEERDSDGIWGVTAPSGKWSLAFTGRWLYAMTGNHLRLSQLYDSFARLDDIGGHEELIGYCKRHPTS